MISTIAPKIFSQNDSSIHKLEQQIERFTSNENMKPLVIKIGKTSLNEYVIALYFDANSLTKVSDRVNNTDEEDTYNLLRNIFCQVTGVEFKTKHLFFDFKGEQLCKLYNTKEQLVGCVNSLKEQFIEQSIKDLSNIDSLDIKNIRNRVSKYYPLCKQFLNVMWFTGESIPESNMQFFPYKNIISLSNSPGFAHTSAGDLVKNFILTPKEINITATDISNCSKPRTIKVESSNIKAKVIKLDNSTSFLEQNITEKFDLILMKRGLCYCDNEKIENNHSCGGIKMFNHQELKKFLFNVSSIMDVNNPLSKALLMGSNYMEPDFWENEIQEFNNEKNNMFIASIIRNFAGSFQGIIIRLNPTSD
jgi:hypothetical protein